MNDATETRHPECENFWGLEQRRLKVLGITKKTDKAAFEAAYATWYREIELRAAENAAQHPIPEWTPAEVAMFEFIAAHEVFIDPEDNQRRALELSLHQKRRLRALADQGLTLKWLQGYLGAIEGHAGQSVNEQANDTWWLRVTMDTFLTRFFQIRRELELAQTWAKLEERRLTQLPVTDKEGHRRALLEELVKCHETYERYRSDPEALRNWVLHADTWNDEPFLMVLLLNFELGIEAQLPGLTQTAYDKYLTFARNYLLMQRPEVLMALLTEFPAQAWFRLSDVEITAAKEILEERQAAWLTQGLVLERKMKRLCSGNN